MTLNTLAEAKAALTVTVTDARLQTLLDLTEQEIIERAGQPGDRTEWPEPAHDFLMLDQPAGVVTAVVEHTHESDLTLATNDYRLSNTGFGLYRLHTGTNPPNRIRHGWAHRVEVTYTPTLTLTLRKAVQMDLVALDLQGPGDVVLEKLGEWEERSTPLAKASAREAALSRLLPGWGIL